MINFEWPWGWMNASFVVAIVAAVLPWLIRPYLGIAATVCAAFNIGFFLFYEFLVMQRYEASSTPGDPLIQAELVLLVPVVLISLASCVFAIVSSLLRRNGQTQLATE